MGAFSKVSQDDEDSFSPRTSPQSVFYLAKLKSREELAHNLITVALETLESKSCQFADARELVQAKRWKETSR